MPLAEKTSSPQPTSGKAESSQPPDHIKLLNRFNLLDLEELDDDVHQSESKNDASSTSQVPAPSKPRKIYQLERSEEELDFAIGCLFNDLHRIQEIVDGAWEDVKLGALEVTGAAVLINVAILLAKHADERFRRTFPNVANKEDNIIQPIYKRRTGRDCLGGYLEDNETEAFRFFYYPTTSIIRYLLTDKQKQLQKQNNLIKCFRDMANHKDADPVDRSYFTEYLILKSLLNNSMYLDAIRRFRPTEFLVDGLTSLGLFRNFRNGINTLWLSFAVQLYLDITSKLGTDVLGMYVKLINETKELVSPMRQLRGER